MYFLSAHLTSCQRCALQLLGLSTQKSYCQAQGQVPSLSHVPMLFYIHICVPILWSRKPNIWGMLRLENFTRLISVFGYDSAVPKKCPCIHHWLCASFRPERFSDCLACVIGSFVTWNNIKKGENDLIPDEGMRLDRYDSSSPEIQSSSTR